MQFLVLTCFVLHEVELVDSRLGKVASNFTLYSYKHNFHVNYWKSK